MREAKATNFSTIRNQTMIGNDEPVVHDNLGHNVLVRRVGHRVLNCNPPYVIGVCGSWGSGKTSFLHKLWAYLDGEHKKENGDVATLDSHERNSAFAESDSEFQTLLNGRKVELVWFNPWQHQFETSPMVALLHEIRDRLSKSKKILKGTTKTAKIGMRALFDSVVKFGAEIGGTMGAPKLKADVQLPTASSVIGLKREYDAADFSARSVSQQFRDYFESAIEDVAGKNGLLVIFIDDLDRCEGDVAYKLLEALKLHLNARNCVYVLGLDQQQLEQVIAKALSGEKEVWRHRPTGRDYLSKMFQSMFLLPVPRETSDYVNKLLGIDFQPPPDKPLTLPDRKLLAEKQEFEALLTELFDFQPKELPKLIAAIDGNLPHNPRKIKFFISSWRLYIETLHDRKVGKLDWRLTLILHYLAQFEEPIFRRIEQAPAFYAHELLLFCQPNLRPLSWKAHPLFDGLELPYEILRPSG
ncbi:MAG: KAP family P-loop NTPase fold protein, partial [Blastocatellia bacterium]